MNDTPSHRLRAAWLDALLPHAPFDGWTEAAADRAAGEAGLSANERALAAPRGVRDLVEAFFDTAERRAELSLADQDLDTMRVRDRVAAGVRAWLDALEPDKEAVRRAAARGFLPWGAGDAMRRSWSIADTVWNLAGDEATDYNRYTKRGLLASVLPAITLYWLNEEDPEKVDAFIARRLDGAMRLGQLGGRVLKPFLNPVAPRPGG